MPFKKSSAAAFSLSKKSNYLYIIKMYYFNTGSMRKIYIEAWGALILIIENREEDFWTYVCFFRSFFTMTVFLIFVSWLSWIGLRCDCFGFDSSSAGALCLMGILFASAFEELFLGDLFSFSGEVGPWPGLARYSLMGRISVCILWMWSYLRAYIYKYSCWWW